LAIDIVTDGVHDELAGSDGAQVDVGSPREIRLPASGTAILRGAFVTRHGFFRMHLRARDRVHPVASNGCGATCGGQTLTIAIFAVHDGRIFILLDLDTLVA